MRFLLFIIVLLTGFAGISQEKEFTIMAKVLDDDNGKKLVGATIEVYTSGKLVTSKVSTGKFDQIYVETGKIYKVYVKKSGYVTKMAEIDSRIKYPEDAGDLGVDFRVSIFKRVEGIDFTYLETTPMTKFRFDETYQAVYDIPYTEEMLRKIEELKRKIAEKKEEEKEKDKKQLKTEADFNAYMEAGNNAMSSKEYKRAVTQYELALGLKKDHAGAKAKLEEAKRLLKEQEANAEKDRQYQAKMVEALNAFKGKEMEKALKLYKEALQIKSSEQEPREKIAEIEKILAEEKALNDKIAALVEEGDKAVETESYDFAIDKYNEALNLRADDEVKTKLEKAKQLKADKLAADKEQEKKNAEYAALIKSAKKLFDDKNYTEARTKYEAAGNLKPDEAVPPQEIKVIDGILEKLKAEEELTAKYEAKLTDAQSEFDAKNWEKSLALYKEAEALKPTETKPKDQINVINEILVKEKANLEAYQKLIKEGDGLGSAQKFEDAIAKYEAAKELKDSDEVRKKIEDAQKALNDANEQAKAAAELERKYKEAIAKADNARDDDQLEAAIESYKTALSLKKDDSYAQAEIDKINETLDKRAADLAAKKKADEAYQALLKSADGLLDNDKLEAAKAKYNEALKERPDDSYPKEKIGIIDQKLNELADQEAKNKAYDEAIKLGQTLKTEEKYEEAIGSFKKALELKPGEALPQSEIDNINKILAERKSEKEKAEAYSKLIAEANQLRDKEEWLSAKAKYSEALAVKEKDLIATGEIEKIDKILAELKAAGEKDAEFLRLVSEGDSKAGQAEFSDAKASYQEALKIKDSDEVKKKIADIDSKLEAIKNIALQQEEADNLIEKGDELYAQKDWENALKTYEAVEKIENAPDVSNKIADIKKKLNDVKAEEEKAEQIKNMIVEAKDQEESKDYEKALKTYQEAYAVRPDPEITEHINRIKGKINEQKAAENLVSNYQNKINEADLLFNEKKWQQALELYQAAKSIKSDEAYPDERIKACKEKIEIAQKRNTRNKYETAVNEAENLFSAKQYDEAIAKFEIAKVILPDETYPQQKIDEIRKLKEGMANAEAEKLEKERQFKALVTEADAAFSTQNFDIALTKYKEAGKLKPVDNYVENRIKESGKKLEALNKAKETADKFKEYIAQADQLMSDEKWDEAIKAYETAQLYDVENDYPKNQIKLAKEAKSNAGKELSENAYQDLLTQAETKFNNKEYKEALTMYKSAFKQRPTDDIPARKISEINQILSNISRVENSKNKYKELISKADNLFERKEWDRARALYVQAYDIENNSYPDSQIKRIDAIHSTFEDDQYKRMIAKADEYFNAENYEKAKVLYKRSIKTFTKKNTAYPKAQIKKINALLNPPELVRAGGGPPVGRKVNMTEEEMQRMFLEAEQSRKEKETSSVANSGSDVSDYILKWGKKEENESYRVVDTETTVLTQIFESTTENQQKQIGLVEEFDTYEVAYQTKMREESTYSDNVIFKQSQVVENIKREEYENSVNNDKDRESFEENVTVIEDDLTSASIDLNTTHSDVLYKQVDKIEGIEVEKRDGYKNIEVGRLNTEIDVNNVEVALVNASMKEQWKQEDIAFNTTGFVENSEAEIYEAAKYSDIPRQNMEVKVTDVNTDMAAVMTEYGKEQTAVSENATVSIEKLNQALFEADQTAELQRQKVEIAKQKIDKSIQDNAISSSSESTDQMFNTSSEIEALKDEQFEVSKTNAVRLNEDNETINEIISEISKNETNNKLINENEMHMTHNHVELAEKTIHNNKVVDTKKTEDNSDVILKKQDKLVNAQIELEKNNEEGLNKTEDVLISIAEIDVNAIDQKVKNELGTQFPEGVTEEIYEQRDEDGLLVSYVVRRVVVIEGEGAVYEKSQMRFGISYTKNGRPITEYKWQDETEDASLIYH